MYTKEQKKKLLDFKNFSNVTRTRKLDRKELTSLFWSTVKNENVGPHPYTTALHAVIDCIEQKGFRR